MKAIHTKYKTFWRRFFAGIIDTIVLSPLWIFDYLFLDKGGSMQLVVSTTLNIVIPYSYSIWMTGKYGATLGKMAAKLKVLDGDIEQSPVGYKRAFYRDSILVVFDLLALIYMIIVWSLGNNSLTDRDQVVRWIDFSTSIWMLAELITMFGNERRRAIHDILANSVVVKSETLQPQTV
jgi:uncharacterized RDD family membrane protein YckC